MTGREFSPDSVLEMALPRDRSAPGRARSAIARFSAEREIDDAALAALKLLVSEVVSNAVIHSTAPSAAEITLRARLLEHLVRVEVIDQGSGFAAESRVPSAQTGGYGLYLLTREAASWGVHVDGSTCVWFEVEGGLRARLRTAARAVRSGLR